jgi:hypothetical protein
MAYYLCSWCGQYQHQKYSYNKGTRTVPEPTKKCECQPTLGLVWRNDAARQSHYHGNKYILLPDGSSQQYFGQRSPGRWINLFTDEAVPKPHWIKWAKVPIILDRSQGREFKALLELHGEHRLVKTHGARRPGLYHALIVCPPDDFFKDTEVDHKRKGKGSDRKPGPLVVVVPSCMRKRYARSPHPKGLNLTTVTEQDRSYDKRIVPRWTEREFAIAKWQYQPTDEAAPQSGKKPLLKYAAPPKEEQSGLIGKHPGGNTWCHTPIHECEWEVDPKPGYDAMRKHLDDHDFKHLRIDWVQRRFLFYTSDGHKSKQTGQIESDHPVYGSHRRVLLWEGECWACQLSVKPKDGPRKVVTPGVLYVADDLTFIATHQCLRIGQSVEEYQKGINLYAPHAAPMSLIDYVRGPLTDYWNRNNKIELIRPKMKFTRAKEAASPHDLQKQLLDKVQKKYAPKPEPNGKGMTATHIDCPDCHSLVLLSEDYDYTNGILLCGECEVESAISLETADLYALNESGTPVKASVSKPAATHVACQHDGCNAIVALEHYNFKTAALHCPVCGKDSVFSVHNGHWWAIKDADWVPAAYIVETDDGKKTVIDGLAFSPTQAAANQLAEMAALTEVKKQLDAELAKQAAVNEAAFAQKVVKAQKEASK